MISFHVSLSPLLFSPSISSSNCPLPSLSQDYLTKNSEENLQFSDSTMNFARHQILSYAREILERSRDGVLNKEQFIVLSENLEATLTEVSDGWSFRLGVWPLQLWLIV